MGGLARSGRTRRPSWPAHDDALRAEMARVPDATLADLRSWAMAALGVTVSLSALSVRLKRLGLTLKKRRSLQRSKPAPT